MTYSNLFDYGVQPGQNAMINLVCSDATALASGSPVTPTATTQGWGGQTVVTLASNTSHQVYIAMDTNATAAGSEIHDELYLNDTNVNRMTTGAIVGVLGTGREMRAPRSVFDATSDFAVGDYITVTAAGKLKTVTTVGTGIHFGTVISVGAASTDPIVFVFYSAGQIN